MHRLAFQRHFNAQARVSAEDAIEERSKAQQVAEARLSERMMLQNHSLAEELQKRRAAKMREEIEVQRICHESEELKALEQ
ncbi:unnamed protein product, partial [Choristocarpus tenellus]